jgi:hypothetical protein
MGDFARRHGRSRSGSPTWRLETLLVAQLDIRRDARHLNSAPVGTGLVGSPAAGLVASTGGRSIAAGAIAPDPDIDAAAGNLTAPCQQRVNVGATRGFRSARRDNHNATQDHHCKQFQQ